MTRRPPNTGGFEHLRPQEPPLELREQVLRAATRGLDEAPAVDLWTRLWDNRVLRLAWAACLVTLITGHAIISFESLRRPSSGPQSASQVPSGAEELQAIAALPPIDAVSLQRGYVASQPDRAGVSSQATLEETEDQS